MSLDDHRLLPSASHDTRRRRSLWYQKATSRTRRANGERSHMRTQEYGAQCSHSLHAPARGLIGGLVKFCSEILVGGGWALKKK